VASPSLVLISLSQCWSVDRAYGFIEDMFGLEHERQTAEDPDDFTYQTVGEVSLEMRRRDETDEERRAFWAF
jgi:hypothetical protein